MFSRHQPVINPPNINTSVVGGAPEVVTPAEQEEPPEPPEERPVPVVSGLALLSPCLGMGIGWIMMDLSGPNSYHHAPQAIINIR